MTVYREQCSLILNRHSLTLKDPKDHSTFVGEFIPVNRKTTKWIEHFKNFVDFSKRFSVTIPVEFGKIPGFPELSNYEKIKTHTITDLARTGLFIELIEESATGFNITFKTAGAFSELVRTVLISAEPFIISAKTLTDDFSREGDIYKEVVQVVGLQLLKNEDLEIEIDKDTLELCGSTVSIFNNPEKLNEYINDVANSVKKPEDNYLKLRPSDNFKGIEVPCYVQIVEASKFISDKISLGNEDLDRVIELNIAAGNGIDFDTNPTAELIESNLKRQVGIDINECFELLEGYITGDVSLIRDALADKRITLNGFQPILPFSLIEDYRDAVQNNFTRFDSSLERAQETQTKYADLGVETSITEVNLRSDNSNKVYYVNKVSSACTDTKGETYAKGK